MHHVDIILVLPTLCLAAVIGFAAHRASICSVGVVEEILTTHRAFMLWSFVKTSLWALGVILIVAIVLPDTAVTSERWTLSTWSLAGGLLFGIGATINGGCAVSTLTRLGSGHLGMIVSLAGFAAGAGTFGVIDLLGEAPKPQAATGSTDGYGPWLETVALGLVIWMTWELVRLIRSHSSEQRWRARLLAPRYRLSTAALLMGLSNGVLYAVFGVWAYTRIFDQGTRSVITDQSLPAWPYWALFAALVAGIVCSAWQGGRFRWQWRPTRNWLGYASGGFCMGFGAALAPGGNDVLIFHAIPSLSPHAVPAFGAMLAGIAATLLIRRYLGGKIPRVSCGGDVCSVFTDPANAATTSRGTLNIRGQHACRRQSLTARS